MKTKHLFLVGCPRSGTTLLQSMVASHSQVISFPETHFFSKTLPINPVLRRLKLHGGSSQSYVNNFLSQNGYNFSPFKDISSYPHLTHSQWCNIVIDVLDKMIAQDTSTDANHDIWGLEKTPRHLHYISSIEKGSSENNFLHILRDGPDVVASLHLATKKYPEQWDGQRSVKKCIRWWNNSIRESMKYRKKPNHFFVAYKQLIEAPEKVLQAVSQFLNLEYQKNMVSNFHQTAESLTQDEEKWKDQNKQESLNKSNKLETYFDSSTINYIKKNTLDIDLVEFYH